MLSALVGSQCRGYKLIFYDEANELTLPALYTDKPAAHVSQYFLNSIDAERTRVLTTSHTTHTHAVAEHFAEDG
jgi:hypothetical protein